MSKKKATWQSEERATTMANDKIFVLAVKVDGAVFCISNDILFGQNECYCFAHTKRRLKKRKHRRINDNIVAVYCRLMQKYNTFLAVSLYSWFSSLNWSSIFEHQTVCIFILNSSSHRCEAQLTFNWLSQLWFVGAVYEMHSLSVKRNESMWEKFRPH